MKLPNGFGYAIRYDLVVKDYARYLDIDRPRKLHKKKPFTVRQRNRLWRGVDDVPEARHVLMLIYSGCRVGEYRHIRKTDVKLRRRVIVIRHSKTDAGAGRLIPIPRKLMPWYEEAMQTPGLYICGRADGSRHSYTTLSAALSLTLSCTTSACRIRRMSAATRLPVCLTLPTSTAPSSSSSSDTASKV